MPHDPRCPDPPTERGPTTFFADRSAVQATDPEAMEGIHLLLNRTDDSDAVLPEIQDILTSTGHVTVPADKIHPTRVSRGEQVTGLPFVQIDAGPTTVFIYQTLALDPHQIVDIFASGPEAHNRLCVLLDGIPMAPTDSTTDPIDSSGNQAGGKLRSRLATGWRRARAGRVHSVRGATDR
jgi:hypothetical protein